jgi:FkbM family methyltransferase
MTATDELRRWARQLLPARAKEALRDTFWRLLRMRTTLRSGLRVDVKGLSDWVVYNDIFVNGEYDAAIDHALASRAPHQPLNVIDLGANTGYFTVRCADLAIGKGVETRLLNFILVEGSPPVFAALGGRMRATGLPEGSWHLIQGLVGAREGAGRMSSGAMSCMNRVVDSGEGGTQVSYLDLRPAIQQAAPIHLLKCDIEGSELLFLETYKDDLDSVQAVAIELHHERCDTGRCLRILREAGFSDISTLREAPGFAVAFARRAS